MKVASVAVFVGMSTSIKLAGPVPAGEIVFFRSFFAVFPVLALFAWRGELRTALSTSHPFSHIARGVVGVAAMSFGFFALMRLPLPEAITLNYAQPLLVVVFSALFLGEAIRVYRWSAVAVGLVGVVIISWPKLTLFAGDGAGLGDREAIGVVAALASASISAVAMLLGAPAGAHREIGDHRAVVLADGERHCAVVDPVRLAGAYLAAGGAADRLPAFAAAWRRC